MGDFSIISVWFYRTCIKFCTKASQPQVRTLTKNLDLPNSQECIDSLLQNLYLTGLFTYENVNENQNYPKNTNDELINDYVQNETKKLEEVLKVRHYSKCTIDRYKKRVQLFLAQNSASESKCYNQSA